MGFFKKLYRKLIPEYKNYPDNQLFTSEFVAHIEKAVTEAKYEFIDRIEKEFNAYLKQNNPDFYTFPKDKSLIFLFKLYDKYYFDEQISQNVKIVLKYSNRLTSAGGNIYCPDKTRPAVISFSRPLIFGAYLSDTAGYEVSGFFCKNPAEALMRIMEHELTHLVEFIFHGATNHTPRFKKLCYDLFRHTEYKHALGHSPTLPPPKHNFRKGDRVCFYHNEVKCIGTIKMIKKRATVMVDETEPPNQVWTDPQNIKPRKYYVPIRCLQKVQ